jgi:ABC-type Fe3+ transport system permease subunit
MKHAKRDWRDFLNRHAVGFGAVTGTVLALGILFMLTQIKV